MNAIVDLGCKPLVLRYERKGDVVFEGVVGGRPRVQGVDCASAKPGTAAVTKVARTSEFFFFMNTSSKGYPKKLGTCPFSKRVNEQI